MISNAVFKELKNITKNNITKKKEDLLCYSYDATGRSFLPDAVVFPSSTNQVSEILKLAQKEFFYVIPRGSGSGMTGGALPVMGGVVMVFTRMNHILKIDKKNIIAIVEPGVITQDLHKAVEKEKLFYPPDPASSSFCTIGGNIGECAGGPRAIKYGVTRDYVLGLEAVLASGEIIKTGVKTAKGVAGYDLTRLIVGSEGTLAIVTKIILKLIPLPEKVKTAAVVFNSMEKAVSTILAIIHAGMVPRCIEYMDKASINCVKNDLSFISSNSIFQKIEAILIIELDGEVDLVEKNIKKLEKLCFFNNASDVIIAKNSRETQNLWKGRKALSPALFKFAPNKINEDIVVPINRIPDMVEKIKEIQIKTKLVIISFGHAGDGNIHCNIMYDKKNDKQASLAKIAVDELFNYTLEIGGTITGEHGVGITKKKYLNLEIGQTEIKIMKSIKQIFDPRNILNPRKIFI
ncbi:MAG: glycolate oxidase subunit GlcD [Desulfobacteraceae bacterium 4572_130]|nr:MAG: glycolate oxidase subunit GlcD [Desulfobacteraceae bacterium 4572_130]